jgi:hypothetical protein
MRRNAEELNHPATSPLQRLGSARPQPPAGLKKRPHLLAVIDNAADVHLRFLAIWAAELQSRFLHASSTFAHPPCWAYTGKESAGQH